MLKITTLKRIKSFIEYIQYKIEDYPINEPEDLRDLQKDREEIQNLIDILNKEIDLTIAENKNIKERR